MSVSPNQLLIESLLNEIEKLRQIRTEATINWRDFAEKEPETLRDLRGIAGNLADIYQGAENAFQRIIRATGENLPAGHDWHRQLLMQARQDIPHIRPPIIGKNTFQALQPYRSFRHLARHHYGFDLTWPEMQPLAQQAEQTIDLLIADLESFCLFLEQVE